LRDLLQKGVEDEQIFQAFDAFDETFAGPAKPEVNS
jgi:hypothetical protein